MDEAIIDSDIVSELIKAKNPRVLHIGADYLSQHRQRSLLGDHVL